MIDFLKILVINKPLIKHIKDNPLLTWYDKNEKLHFDFEQIIIKETYTFKGILFCFHANKLEILFKPHYYFNDNIHNANDFKSIDCINVLNEFINTFRLHNYCNELKIINLEYAINVISPIDCKELITFLSYHGKNEFRTDNNLPYSKKSFKDNKNGTANQYKIIKAYNKGIQYPEFTNINTFRFEVKSKQSKYINSIGINSIYDTLNLETYKTLSKEILKEWREVLILSENKTFKQLTTKENNLLNKYLNPNNWYKLKQQSRNQFYKTKKRYFKLLEKTGQNIHKDVEVIISEKLKELNQIDIIEKKQKGAISRVYIIGNCTQNKNKVCQVTGLSLIHEKGCANYIRTTTLRLLKEHNPKTYLLLKSEYLGLNITKPKFETNEIKHIAKNIRNKFNNRNKIKQTGYNKPINKLQLSLDV